MKGRVTAIAFLVALAIPTAASAWSSGMSSSTEPTKLTADKNEVAVEGVIAPAKPPRVLDIDMVI
jgi:hypothetical protein